MNRGRALGIQTSSDKICLDSESLKGDLGIRIDTPVYVDLFLLNFQNEVVKF